MLLRPDRLELALDHLDRQGLDEILVLITFLILELYGTEGRLEVRGLERVADAVLVPGLGPFQRVLQRTYMAA